MYYFNVMMRDSLLSSTLFIKHYKWWVSSDDRVFKYREFVKAVDPYLQMTLLWKNLLSWSNFEEIRIVSTE